MHLDIIAIFGEVDLAKNHSATETLQGMHMTSTMEESLFFIS